MNCESCESLLLDLVYGEVDTATSARAREHLVGCASCRAASEKLESARRIVRQLPMATPSAHVHAALVARADAAMPQHGHGMNVAPTVKQVAPGTYRVDGMLFHMPGYWELYFDLSREGVMERAQGAVTLE